MTVETALEEMLHMIQRRALNVSTLPDDERHLHYDLIRRSTCRAAEQIGQSADLAADTADKVVEFTRALVGMIDSAGEGADSIDGDAGAADSQE